MTDLELSSGAIERMMQIEKSKLSGDATCQVLSIKKLEAKSQNPTVNDRYRLVLSDGVHYIQAMLSTHLKPLVEEGQLERNSIIYIVQFTKNMVQDRGIIILLNIQVVQTHVPYRIGNPQNYDTVAKAESTEPSIGAQALHAPAPARTGAPQGAPRKDTFPIESLSPYQNKWMIRARVTHKSDVKHWSNARGDGKLFSVNLLDQSGEIRATAFNDAVDRFYPILQENGVYYISKAKVNIAKKQFNTLNNEYEITLESSSEVEPCNEASDVPEVKYNFCAINQLDTVEPNQTTDVIAILDSYSEVSEITSKATQRQVKKRELTLIDSSNTSVRLTLWGQQAENFEQSIAGDPKPVIAFKGVKVSDFGGRSLSMFSSSTMTINPDIPESHGLRGWYENEGSTAQIQGFSAKVDSGAAGTSGPRPDERRTLVEVKDSSIGTSAERADYFNSRASILYIRPNSLYYPACPTCNKKVVDVGDEWRCEKCDKVWEAPVRRYIFSANVADYTEQIWISGFDEIGQEIIGMTADELDAIRNENEGEFKAVLNRAVGKMYTFSCRAKQDTFNDTTRTRYTVTKAFPVDFAKAGHDLVDAINALQNKS
ncbi:Replication factor A protein 1 [Malassezia cuniculi]|uniref:Replication protein A subunit n=1 Tax=Malassezia cuniculi TaxID=948313 RepID=A0AAF0ERJ5_9BASI|nr:Replication factor A protein 1 [Malassezia cuniculi]